MTTIMNLSIAFVNEYKERFAANRFVDILKDVMGSDFLTVMSFQSQYRYIRFAKMMWNH